MDSQVDELITMLEDFSNKEFTTDLPNVQILIAVRDALYDAGMNSKDRDMFVARAKIEVPESLTDEQLNRLKNVATSMAVKMYRTYKDMGFCDEAISLTGTNFYITLE